MKLNLRKFSLFIHIFDKRGPYLFTFTVCAILLKKWNLICERNSFHSYIWQEGPYLYMFIVCALLLKKMKLNMRNVYLFIHILDKRGPFLFMFRFTVCAFKKKMKGYMRNVSLFIHIFDKRGPFLFMFRFTICALWYNKKKRPWTFKMHIQFCTFDVSGRYGKFRNFKFNCTILFLPN